MNADAKKRYKDIDFPFTCPITNREFNNPVGLSVYLTKTLKINHEEYYLNHINHRDRICFFCGGKGKFISVSKGFRNLCDDKTCVKKSFNSHSVEGFMYRNMCSREEAERLFQEENKRQLEERTKTQNKLREEDPLWDKKRSRNCKEFWINKGCSIEEAEKFAKESMDDIHKKTSDKLKSNPEKYAYKYPTRVEYYLSRGYDLENAKNEISKIQNRFSLQGCIDKYGEETGKEIWLNRQEKWANTLNSKTEEEKIEINRKKLMNGSGYSKISQELFWRLYDNFSGNDVRFEELNSEIIRYDKENKSHYRYDYVDFTLKKCIEFNGDYWHCNPKKYNEDFQHPIIKMSASKIWEKDNNKIIWMENRNFKILTVWESDYRKNPKQIIDKCIEFLNGKDNDK